MIILTAQDYANLNPAANGLVYTAPGNAIQPIPLADGTYMLPERVLTDAAHFSVWGQLRTKQTRAVLETEVVSLQGTARANTPCAEIKLDGTRDTKYDQATIPVGDAKPDLGVK